MDTYNKAFKHSISAARNSVGTLMSSFTFCFFWISYNIKTHSVNELIISHVCSVIVYISTTWWGSCICGTPPPVVPRRRRRNWRELKFLKHLKKGSVLNNNFILIEIYMELNYRAASFRNDSMKRIIEIVWPFGTFICFDGWVRCLMTVCKLM